MQYKADEVLDVINAASPQLIMRSHIQTDTNLQRRKLNY